MTWTDDRGEAAPRVSVVVPVYNPGPYLEPGIASILRQTLPAGQVEAIFVDDGSTDGTAARLDRLAADYPDRVRVIHIPPSGAPGRPRNIGIEAARGEYIQFLDADDELALDALERLVAMADRNRSDIVVGKFASASIPRSQRLFERTVDRTTLADMPLLVDGSLGPAKLFRRTLLRKHGIAFPEGWRVMEDQHFCLHAYFRAGVISILADHPCYFFHRRQDGAHLTAERIDPERHVANLRTIIDLVDAETVPGPLRDRILRRLLRVEVLARVAEPAYPDLPEDDRVRLFVAARDVLRERFRASVVDGLAPIGRVQSELLREDRPAELLAVAERLADLDLSATLQVARWRGGKLEIEATTGLAFTEAGRPLVVVQRGQRRFLDPTLADEPLGWPLDVTEEMAGLRVNLILQARPSALEWHVRAHAAPVARPRVDGLPGATSAADQLAIPVSAEARAGIDLLRIAAGVSPIGAGTWDVLIRLSVLGIQRSVPLGASHASGVAATCLPALLGDPSRVVVPIIDVTGLHLEVDPPPAVLAGALAEGPIRVVRDGARLILELAMASGPSAAALSAELVIRTPGEDRLVPARLRARHGGVVLDASLAGLVDLAPGPHPILLRLGGPRARAEVPIGEARSAGPSRLRVEGLPRLSTVGRRAAAARWPLVRLDAATRRIAARVDRGVRRRGRAVIRRLR